MPGVSARKIGIFLIVFLPLFVIAAYLMAPLLALQTREITLSTALPDAPSTMPIYKTSPLSGAEIQTIVDNFSMGAAGVETDTIETKRLVSGSKELTIQKRTGVFDYTDWSIAGTTATVSISTDTAVSVANTYLSNRGLLDGQTFLRRTGNTVESKKNGWSNTTEFILVYGKKVFDGIADRFADGPGAKTYMVIGKGDQVGMVMQNMPKLEAVGSTETITGAQAFERLKKWPRNLVEIATVPKQTVINSVKIVYYVPVAYTTASIEPVYLFEGTVSDGQTTSRFYQVVPALLKTKIEELKPFLPLKGDQGGRIVHQNGRAAADFAPGTFSGTLEGSIEETSSANYPPPAGTVAYDGNVYDFSSDTSFTTSTLSFNVGKADDLFQAGVYTWDGANWQPVTAGKKINVAAREVLVDVNHFSIYGVFGPPPPTGLNKSMLFFIGLISLALGAFLFTRRSPRMVRIMVHGFIAATLILELAMIGQVRAADEAYSSGISNFNDRHGCSDSDETYGEESARGFTTIMAADGFSVTTAYQNSAASYQWLSSDSSHIEEKDIAFINTHGYEGGSGFRFNWDGDLGDCNVIYGDNPSWGGTTASGFDNDLEVAAIKACQVLIDGSPDPIDRWGGAFDGIHEMLSFSTDSLAHANFGLYFSYYMVRTSPYTVWEAWKKAAVLTNGSASYDVRASMIFVDSPSSAYAKYDYLTSHGSQAADNTSPTSSELTWTRSLVN